MANVLYDTPSMRKLVVQPYDGMTPVLGIISGAKSTLRIKQFTLTDPIIVDSIVAAHVKGVDVRVLLNPKRPDGKRENDETMERFKKMNIKADWTNPAFIVTHEKSIVADSSVALIATFNLAAKYFSETRDYGIITTDPDQVSQIADCFDADWTRTSYIPGKYVGLLWSIHDSRTRIADFIDTAKKHLYIQHPKFVDVPILDRIVHAKARGVHVHFICSGKHGVQEWDRPDTFSSFRIMHNNEIKIHVLKVPKLHAKLIMKDGESAIIGSMNIHRRAFDERRELGIMIKDRPLIEKLHAQFEEDWKLTEHFNVPDPLEKAESDIRIEDIWI